MIVETGLDLWVADDFAALRGFGRHLIFVFARIAAGASTQTFQIRATVKYDSDGNQL